MLRQATLILLTVTASGAAFGADQMATPAAKRHIASQLPAGLPRPHYNHTTTVVYGARRRRPSTMSIRTSELAALTTPILPGSSTLPGNYGRAFDYDYQGAYYGGGPYPSYFFRLPYACGVYGYC